MKLNWYYFFSYWVFIWFILFKLGLLNSSPYFLYIIVFTFIVSREIIKRLVDQKKSRKVYKYNESVFTWYILMIIVDIIPFLLLEKDIGKNSLLTSFFLVIGYLIFNSLNNINLLDQYIYFDVQYVGDNLSLKNLLKAIFI